MFGYRQRLSFSYTGYPLYLIKYLFAHSGLALDLQLSNFLIMTKCICREKSNKQLRMGMQDNSRNLRMLFLPGGHCSETSRLRDKNSADTPSLFLAFPLSLTFSSSRCLLSFPALGAEPHSSRNRIQYEGIGCIYTKILLPGQQSCK